MFALFFSCELTDTALVMAENKSNVLIFHFSEILKRKNSRFQQVCLILNDIL